MRPRMGEIESIDKIYGKCPVIRENCSSVRPS
jgi:hypothetical protein